MIPEQAPLWDARTPTTRAAALLLRWAAELATDEYDIRTALCRGSLRDLGYDVARLEVVARRRAADALREVA